MFTLCYDHSLATAHLHVPVAQVVHLRVEADDLAGHVASPVAGDHRGDGPRLAAEAAQPLVVTTVA